MKKTVLFSALIALFTIFITPTISYAEDTGEEGWWQDPGTGINYDSYEECKSQNSGYGCDFVGENFTGDIGEDDSGEYGDGNYMCCDIPHDDPYTSYEECAMDCGDPSQCTPGSDWNMACDSENGDGCDPDSRCAQCCIQYDSSIDEYNVCENKDSLPPDCESSMFTWEDDGMLYACNSCTEAYVIGGTGTDINCNYLKALYYEEVDTDGTDPNDNVWVVDCQDAVMDNTGIQEACGGKADCINAVRDNSFAYVDALCYRGDAPYGYDEDVLNRILAEADYRYNAGCAPKISGPRCDVMDAVYAHYRNTLGGTLTCGYTYNNVYQSDYGVICERVFPNDDSGGYDCHYNIAKNCETYNAALDAVDDDPYGPYRYLQNNKGVTNCKANVVSSCDVLEALIDAYNDAPNEDYYTLRDTACESMSGSDEGTVNEEEAEICYNNLTRMSYAYEPTLKSFEGSDVTLGSFVEELSDYNYNLNCSDWCPAGQYNKRGMCLDCPKGTYQYDEGMDYCDNCYAGSYQDQVGQTECKDCPSHTALGTNGSKITVSATSPEAATKITDCHVPTGKKFKGLHGIYQFNPYCPYSE